MANNCKRFLSLLLALVMVIGLMPMGHVHAEEESFTMIGEQVTQVEENETYVITLHGTMNALTNRQGSGDWGTHTLATAGCGRIVASGMLWTLESAEGGYRIKNESGYLTISRNAADLNETGHVFELIYHENAGFTIKSLDTSEYGNNLGDSGSIGGWSGDGTKFDLYTLVEVPADEADPFGKLRGRWTKVSVDTETIYDAKEGLFEYAWDNDSGTIWHSNWQGATDKLTGENSFSGVIDFGQAYELNRFSFTPRVGNSSGQITQASLYVRETEDAEWIPAAEHATFAANGDRKDIDFETQAVRYVKFVAEQSSDGWVAVSEFDVDCIASGGEEDPEPTVRNAKILSNNTIVALRDCEYTLGGEENAYSLSHGGTYYVKPCANGSVIPQTIGEFSNLTLTWQDNGSVWIGSTLDGRSPGGGSIHIWTAGKDVPYWDRCGSGHGWNSSNGTHDLYLFRADENSTNAAIPGYTQVTAEDVQVGESYLIAACQGESTWYIMNPTASTEKFEHIALLVGEEVTHEHAFGEPTVTEATCTAAGQKTYACDCGHIHTEIIPATGEHSYEAVVTAPTCTEGGYTTYTCSVCGDSYVADETAALGHTFGEWMVTTAPTCTEAGVETRTCACGETETRAVEALGHTEEVIPAVAPTCTETGLTEGKKCTVCGETLVAQEVVDALGHDYEAVVTEPDCENGGYTTYTCTRCGDSYIADETAALGHEYEDGSCIRCGEADPSYNAVIAEGWSGYTTWVLTSDGTITFTSSGEKLPNGESNLKNYWKVDGVLSLPWGEYADMITRVVINEGIHDIGQMAFYELPNLTEVVLPESAVEIRGYAFKNCAKLTTINLEVVDFIREGAFYGCSALQNIQFAEGVVIEDWAFTRTPVAVP